MVHCLAEPEGIHYKEETAVAIATSVLDYMTMHSLPRLKYWTRDGRTWCIIRQGREVSYQADYFCWWKKEGIDLEGARLASGVAEAVL